ncbi:RNA polymerase sigma factor [Arachidicoccus rhizosphaerae]|nr:sigma-70 family RNA polymerase sigma factor [Arachidicoccus rhizosphaerae]
MNGDQKAFHDFYLLWETRIYSYFLNRTGDYMQSQELTQNTFIKIWEYRSTLSNEHKLETQLFRKAKLIYIDWLRLQTTIQKRKVAEKSYAEITSSDSMNVQQPSLETLPEKLEKAICHLPPMRQKVLRLSHIQGYAYKEIANELKISEKTVDNHINKALKQLRQILSGIVLALLLIIKFI